MCDTCVRACARACACACVHVHVHVLTCVHVIMISGLRICYKLYANPLISRMLYTRQIAIIYIMCDYFILF